MHLIARFAALLVCSALAACSTTPPPDVQYVMDTFRTPAGAGVEWVAWTSRGLSIDGEVVASPGDGCLPSTGWPDEITWVPAPTPGFWLYGTEPRIDGDSFDQSSDRITFDCFVALDGATGPADAVSFRFGDKPDPADNAGSLPVAWRQSGQSSVVTMLTPNGPQPWQLSESKSTCWLSGARDRAWSACVSPGQPGLEFKDWRVTPQGLLAASTEFLELPGLARGAAKAWISDDGQLAVADVSGEAPESTVWARFGAAEFVSAKVSGTLTSAVFDGTILRLLSVRFSDGAYMLSSWDGDQMVTRQLPEHMRPTRLHQSSDGTLWGAGIGGAWRLERFR